MKNNMFQHESSRDYQDFLATKRAIAPTSGIEVAIDDIHPMLFEFQRTLVQWALRKGRAAIFADTGLGKTLISVECARLAGQRTLILAPLSVARQTVNEARKIGVEIHYTRSGSDLAQINITNYEMLDHFNPDDFGMVILDECFAPDTLIDTPSGATPIKDIRAGDFIYNAAGVDQVADVHRREVQYAVRITVNSKSIVSSPNHPYFTQRGWIGAQDIQPGDSLLHTSEAVRVVRGRVHAQNKTSRKREAILQSILLSEMAYAPAGTSGKSPYTGSSEETRGEEKSLACIGQSIGTSRERAYKASQSINATRSERKDLPPIERNPAQTFRAWGQRDWINDATTDTAGCTRQQLDSGICFITGAEDSRLSHELQTRLSESRVQNRYRGGWTLASFSQGVGPEERCETGFSRVDSLEVLEPGHPDLEKLRDADGHIYLYDIGATRHPSFSINGVLVHNSSILKSLAGKTRDRLIEMFADTPYRLAFTATPAPNDITEIANHAEFLGVMTRVEMLAMFFIHESDSCAHGGWRLKGHATDAFYRWMASWSMSVKKPSDIGFSDDGYILPALRVRPVIVETEYRPEDQLFFAGLKGITDRSRARRGTIEDRVARAVDMVQSNDDQWILWCGMNDESSALARAIPGSVEIVGADSPDKKIASIEAFQNGHTRVLITKPSIAGFGINLQSCHNMAFIGLSDSFEAYYQCIRRCYRFGQQHPVNVSIILSDIEQEVYQNVTRKEQEAEQMSKQLIERVQTFERAEIDQAQSHDEYSTDTIQTAHYKIMLGDSCERMAEMADNSVDLSVFSPPFQSLYTYSPTDRDLGNSRSAAEFYEHFNYVIDHLLRVTKPGRDCCVHVQQIAASLVHDGFIGLKDFRGDVIRAFVDRGWIYHGEVCIDKDPQVQAIRSHSKSLLFVQLRKDASWMRPAFADYIIIFRKPGENTVPVKPDITNEEWIAWARPIWYGIKETETLNAAEGRDDKDERHVCPLQLGTIERCIRLWSNPGETVFSPFMGIGSEGYEAIRHGRKFVGIELKESYFRTARKNLDRMIRQQTQATLFDLVESEAVGD